MDGKFTFADAQDPEWVHEVFDTMGEALQEGAKVFKKGVLVGQLKSQKSGYKIVNVYEFKEIASEELCN